jgi:small subunit ribosomal protein S12
MVTLHQSAAKKARIARFIKRKRLALNKCPQKRGTCVKVYILTPRKPCSARRAFTRVKLSNKKIISAHIPGEGHNLKKFSVVLIRGGRPNDLPAVKYRTIRAARKTDLHPVYQRKKARSKYGVRNIHRLHKIRSTRGVGEKIYYRFA